MYTTNTKAGLWAVRRIPAPEVVTSTFVPGMANRLVSIGGGVGAGGGKDGMEDTCPNSSSGQELGGAGRRRRSQQSRDGWLFQLIPIWGCDSEHITFTV